MKAQVDSIRIYVACLAAYNNGHLHGAWIDATQDVDSIFEEIQAMLAASPMPDAEEWAIHDYEGFGGIHLSENEDIEKVCELAALIAEHGEAYALFVDFAGVHYATPEGFEDSYCGEWESEEAYAENLWDECGYWEHIPENLRCYIDMEKFAHDLFIDDYYSERDSNGKLHVFSRC